MYYEHSVIKAHREAKDIVKNYTKANRDLEVHIENLVEEVEEEKKLREIIVDKYDRIFENTKVKVEGMQAYHANEIKTRKRASDKQQEEALRSFNDNAETGRSSIKEQLKSVFDLKNKICNKTRQLETFSDIKEMNLNKMESKYKQIYSKEEDLHK